MAYNCPAQRLACKRWARMPNPTSFSSVSSPSRHFNSSTNRLMRQRVSAASEGIDAGVSNEHLKKLLEDKRFFCTQCGKCCTGDGEVWVSQEEVTRISAFLGLAGHACAVTEKQFLYKYTKSYSKAKGWRMLKYKAENDDCIFLDSNNQCSIHSVRPLQCSTYPWWPGLVDRKDWDREKELICEGFDHAEAGPTDLDAAAEQLRAATEGDLQRMLSKTYPNMEEVQKLQLLLWPEEPSEEPSEEASGEPSGEQQASQQEAGEQPGQWQ